MMHAKNPRRSPLRLRFMTCIIEEISCAICITYFPTIPYGLIVRYNIIKSQMGVNDMAKHTYCIDLMEGAPDYLLSLSKNRTIHVQTQIVERAKTLPHKEACKPDKFVAEGVWHIECCQLVFQVLL